MYRNSNKVYFQNKLLSKTIVKDPLNRPNFGNQNFGNLNENENTALE